MFRGYSGVEDRSYAVRALSAARDLSRDRPRRLSLSAALAASALMTRNVEPLGAEACCSMAKRRCSTALLRWIADSCVIVFSDCSIRRLPPFLASLFGGSNFGLAFLGASVMAAADGPPGGAVPLQMGLRERAA